MFSLRSLLAAAILLTFAGCPRKARDDDSKGAASAAPAAAAVVDDDAGIDGDIPEPPPMPGSGGTGDAGPFHP